MQKIIDHRQDMNFSNTEFGVNTKLEEELNELLNELKRPTTQSNLKKELFDCMVMIVAKTRNMGLTTDELIEWGIRENQRRVR